MPDNSIIASTVRPVDLQPLTYTLQLNGGTEAVVTAAQPRPLDVLLEAHTISVGPSVETVVNIGAPRKVVSLLQFGTPGEDGADGDQLELRVTGDMLQWRLEGQVAWLDLVDLTTVVPGTLWGLIGGTLSNQTDLQAALDAKLDDTQATPTGLAVLGAADAAAGRTALAAAAAGANTDLTSVVLGNTGLSFKDVDGSNKITLTTTSDLTVDATLSFVMTASRVITISGDTALNQALLTSSTPQFAGVNVGHATDTTVGRTSAGVINVEGVNVLLANQMAVANGLATLDAGGKIPSGQLPAIAITSTFPVASQAAMLALTAETGDVAVRSDLNKSFILGGGGNPATLADWIELLTPTDTVLSVNGQTGAVSLTTTNISEGGNLYFTTARVLATALTGFAAAGSRTAIVATDTILAAFGKVQKYLNDLSALAFSGNASDLAGTKTAAFISDFATAADARIAAASLDALNDVDLTGAVDGQVLKRVAGVWVPGTDLSGGGGGGLSDADYGDIVVSGGATVFTIDAGVVSYAKIQSVTANSVLARAAGTNGTVGEVALAASQLLGRGSTGDVASIALGTGLSMAGTTLNASGGGGVAVKVSNALNTATSTTATLIPNDDTIPQSTEGAEFLTVTHTPALSTNKLRIDVTVFGNNPGYYGWCAALFKDSDTNALAAGATISFDYGDLAECVTLTHYMTAGSTSPITFKVRCGAVASGSFRINGGSTGRLFGGALTSSITVTEINPAATGGSGSMADGDYGDLVISGGGASYTVDNDAITYAKMQDVSATARLLGRKTAGAGDVEELSVADLRTITGEGIAILASDFANSTVTFTDVTGMAFTADANATYLVEIAGTFQTAVATTGMGIGLNLPSGVASGGVVASITTTTINFVQQTGDDAILANSTGVAVAATNYPFIGRWLVRVEGTGGTVQLRFRSEVAASNATLKAGATGIAGTAMTWKKIN